MESQLQIWDIFRDFSNDNVSLLRSARLAHVHGNIAILITHEDDVYLATRRNDLVPPNVVKVPELCGKEGKEFIVETNFMMMVTKNGELYAWSHYSPEPIYRPQQKMGSLSGRFVTSAVLSPGSVIALVLTDDGHVHQWGFGLVEPFLIQVDATMGRIKSLVCSYWISLALMENGEVFYWVTKRSPGKPKKLEAPNLPPFKKITASKTNILGLTVQGSVHFVSPAAYLWCDIPKFSNVRDITTHFTEETCVFHLMEENLVAKNVAEDESISHIFLNNGIDEIFAILYQKSYRSFNPQIKFGCDTAQRTLCEDIAGLWNSDDTDVTFSIQGRKIKAHRVILKCRSIYFAKMFDNEWKESRDSYIDIPDVKFCVFEAFLYYIYHARVYFSVDQYDNILGLLKLADCYCETVLRKECELILMQNINSENAFFLFENAYLANATELENGAFNFLLVNRSTLLDNIEGMDALQSVLGPRAMANLVLRLLPRCN
ncbi:RCC1 and BTB domain-containing protein 1 [Folsomia candida]|uniref:RCC1 and BTB domain-containing protein 1 n=1 Tax=Folsomia candida TaxID=158441 RepID=UPI001604F6D3|nr:RCC1 and BTB domain-containing protein 1 [Folsomia candida]